MISTVTTRGQSAAQRLMTDTCVISRAAEPVFNEDTGAYTVGTGETMYSGVCRVKAENMAGSGDRNAGERVIVAVRLTVSVPVSVTDVRVDDVALVTAADAGLNGQAFRVTDVEYQSHGTARRLHVEAYQT